MNNYMYKKIKYQAIEKEPLILNEYMIFKDYNSNEKFLIMDYYNDGQDTIIAMKFEVTQLNRDGKLIRKADYNYDNFEVHKNKHFVPFGKVKVDENCETIEVKLISALFKTKRWANGEWIQLENYNEQDSLADENIKLDHSYISTRLKTTGLNFPFLVSILILVIFVSISIFGYSIYGNYAIQDVKDEFSFWELSDGSIVINKYTGYSNNVIIPNQIDGKVVKEIAPYTFQNSNAKTVTIYADKIRISSYAFSNSKRLEKIIGKDITVIDAYAFAGCTSLKEVSFERIDLIKEGAFSGCNNLEEFSNESFVRVEALAFEDCYELKYVNLPNATLSTGVLYGNKKIVELSYNKHNSVTKIGDLFGVANNDVPKTLKRVSLGIDYISKDYFAKLNQITNIEIKNIDSVIIDYGAFKDCSLINYTYTNEMEILNNTLVTIAPDITKLQVYGNIEHIASNAFYSSRQTLHRLEIYTYTSITLTEDHFKNFYVLNYLVLDNTFNLDTGALYPVRNTLSYLEIPVIGNYFEDFFKQEKSTVAAVRVVGDRTLPNNYFRYCDYIEFIDIDNSVKVQG